MKHTLSGQCSFLLLDHNPQKQELAIPPLPLLAPPPPHHYTYSPIGSLFQALSFYISFILWPPFRELGHAYFYFYLFIYFAVSPVSLLSSCKSLCPVCLELYREGCLIIAHRLWNITSPSVMILLLASSNHTEIANISKLQFLMKVKNRSSFRKF